jgi:uncharacterized protein (TIGR03067 family)
MRLTQIMCPKCKASLTSKAGIEEGTSIACPKCNQKFDASAPDQEVAEDFEVVDDDEEEAPRKKPSQRDDDDDDRDAERSGPKKRRNDDDDDDRPAAKKRSRNDDDDDRPAAKKRSRNDDGDDRPRPKKKRKRRDEEEEEELGAFGQLKKNIWVRISVLAVLFGILGVLSYFLFLKNKEDTSAPVVNNTDDDDPSKPIKPNPKKSSDTPTANDTERFQGSWTAIAATADGEEYNAQGLKSLRFTVKADRWIYQNQTAAKNGSRSKIIDSAKKPAEIDFIDQGSNKTTHAIYRFIDKDTLEICCNRSDSGARPKEFAAPKGSNCLYMKLKHGDAKSNEIASKDPKSKDPKPAASDADRLKGSWRASNMTYPQEAITGEVSRGVLPAILALARQNDINKTVLTITEDQWILDEADEADQYTINSSKNPAEIELVHPDGKTSHGIYRFENKDTLEVCFLVDGSRPKSFTPAPGENPVRIKFDRIP